MPIQSIEPATPQGGTNFAPIPAGIYQVQIQDIKDEARIPWDKRNEADAVADEQTYNFEFVVLNEGEHYGRRLWKTARAKAPTPAKGKAKATATYAIVCAAINQTLTYDEGLSFSKENFNDLIGKQLQLVVSVEPKQNGDGFRNSITSYVPATAELPAFVPQESSSDGEINVEDIPF